MAASALRIGVVVDAIDQPAWIAGTIARLRERGELAFVRVVVSVAKQPRESAMQRLYRRIDDRLHGGATLQRIDAIDHGGDADLVLAFAPFDRTNTPVWRIELDDFGDWLAHARPPRARIVSGERIVAETTAMQDTISYRRAANRLAQRAAAMIENELRRGTRPPGSLATLGMTEGEGNSEARSHASATPQRGKAATTLINSAIHYLRLHLQRRTTRAQWILGYAFGEDPLTFRNFKPIVPPADRLWADPHVVVEDGRTWIFIEEMTFAENRGVISVMELRSDGTYEQPRRIIERPYHMSYPCVFRWAGQFFMVPESHEAKKIQLFRCTSFPFEWEEESTLMEADAVDTTVFEAFGRWWMYYATDGGDGAGFDRLWLFHAESPRGPWLPHPRNPLECNVIGGRPGGRPFQRHGRWYRAAQIGTPIYGRAIQLREIVKLTPDEWEEREVAVLDPTWMRGLAGMHTLTSAGDVTIVDGVRRVLKPLPGRNRASARRSALE